MYTIPIEGHIIRHEETVVKCNFSKLVGKVSAPLRWLQRVDCGFIEYKRCYIYLPVLGQILERDETYIVPSESQRLVDAESVNFIEKICKFCIFEGIHRCVVNAAE